MSQSESPLAHIASWTGVAGLTFLMVAFTAAVIEWARVARFRDVRTALPALGLAALLLARPRVPDDGRRGRCASAARRATGRPATSTSATRNAVLNAQLEASAPLFGEDIDVLLWPEGGIDSDPLANESTASTLDALSRARRRAAHRQRRDRRAATTRSTPRCCGSAGEGAVQLHDKTHPVPMGEYVPDRWFYEMLAPDLIGLIQREYTPGTNPPFFDLDGVGVGLAICFDVIYDDVIWTGARDGAAGLHVPDEQRRLPRHRREPAAARLRADARDRDRPLGRQPLDGRHEPGDRARRHDDRRSAGGRGRATCSPTVPLRTGLTPAVVVGPVDPGAPRLGEPRRARSRSASRSRVTAPPGRENAGPRRNRRRAE